MGKTSKTNEATTQPDAPNTSDDGSPDTPASEPAFPLEGGSSFGLQYDGGDFAAWQKRMVERGWRLRTDGRFDNECRAVVFAFQRANGLEANGQVDLPTWAAVWAA